LGASQDSLRIVYIKYVSHAKHTYMINAKGARTNYNAFALDNCSTKDQ